MPEGHPKTTKHETAPNVADTQLQVKLDQALALHRSGHLDKAEAI